MTLHQIDPRSLAQLDLPTALLRARAADSVTAYAKPFEAEGFIVIAWKTPGGTDLSSAPWHAVAFDKHQKRLGAIAGGFNRKGVLDAAYRTALLVLAPDSPAPLFTVLTRNLCG